MADGTIVIDTEIDSSDFGKTLDGFSEDVKKAASELYDLMKRQKEVAASHKQNTAEVQKTSAALDRLIEKQIRYTETGGRTDNRTFAQMEYDIEKANAALTSAKIKQNETAQALSYLNASIDTTRAKLQAMATQEVKISENSSMLLNTVNGIKQAFRALLPTLAKATKALFSFVGRSMITGVRKLWSGLKKVATSLTSINRGAKRSNRSLLMMLGSSLLFSTVFRAISALINSFKEGIQNLAQYSNEANASMSSLKTAASQLKNSLATAFMPLITIITPALVNFINLLSKALTTIGAFFSALSGKNTFTKAVTVQQDYAEGLKDTSKNAKEAKKSLNQYLSGLDEIKTFTAKQNEEDTEEKTGVSPSDMFTEQAIPEGVSAFADRLKEVFNKLKEFFKNRDWDGLGKYLADGVNKAFKYLYDALNWENVKDKIVPIIEGLTGTFNSFVDNLDWNAIGRTVGAGFNTLVNIIYEFITGINWRNLGKKFGEGVNGLFKEIDWAKAGTTIGEAVKGLLDLFIGAIEETDWQLIGNSIADFIGGIDWSGIIARLFEGIGAILGGLGALIRGLLEDAWNSAVDWWYDVAFEDGKFTMKGLLEGILEGLKDIGTWIMDHIVNPFIEGFKKGFGIHSPSTVMAALGVFLIKGLLNGIESLFGDLESSLGDMKDIIVGKLQGIKEEWDAKWDAFAEKVSGVWGTISDTVSGAVSKMKGWIEDLIGKFNDAKSKLSSLSSKARTSSVFYGGIGSNIGNIISSIGNIKIPKLASGTVIPPNSPYMAILGDQKHGTNIEAPLDTIKQAVREVMGNGGTGGDVRIPIQIDGMTIIEAIIPKARIMQASTGQNVFTTL